MRHPIAGAGLVVLLGGVADAAEPFEPRALPPAAAPEISAALGRAQARYHAVARAGGLRMENPTHGLFADFTPAAVQVRSGTARWGMSLEGYGYGSEPPAVAVVAPEAMANRVEYRRGALVEWYLNGPMGLEQGFTIPHAPGRSAGASLTLAFRLSGNLTATAAANGKDAILRRSSGAPALRYRGLTAQDATGRELRSWLRVERDRLFLHVDDTGVRYPVTVDPFIERAVLTAGDGAAGDLFGVALAVDGDTIVVGATGADVDGNVNQGVAYVFVKPAGGWSEPVTETARLVASDGAAGDLFGSAAVDGDTVVIGAAGNSPAAPPPGEQPIRGSAYVFVRPAGGWSGTLHEQARLTASDGAPNDKFGASVGIDGDTIVASSEWDNGFRGSAYVFVKPAAGWSGPRTENAKLVASDGRTGIGIGDAFGRAAIDGDTIVIGALGADVVVDGFTRTDAGAAYVFVKPAGGWSGLLTQRAKLRASDLSANDRFGASVALDGDLIVVGAPLDDTDLETNHGSAYAFVKPPAGWTNATQNAKLLPSDLEAGDQFGAAVAVEGDTIAVGAFLNDIGPGANDDEGAAYVFVKPAGGWQDGTETRKLLASEPGVGDEFGSALAMNGDVLLVGARRDDVGANVDQGSVSVLLREQVPAAIALDPETAANPVGTTHTVTAAVRDAGAQPVPAAEVHFEVTGSVLESGGCTTDAAGQCGFSYVGPSVPGADQITAFVDTDADGVHDPEEPGTSATKTWVPGAPAAIVLAPAAAENTVGTSHTVTARVADSFGNPIPAVAVHIAVTGEVSTTGQCLTDLTGQCAFTYTGPTATGADTLTAFADTDGDGVHALGEPSATATKTWVAGPAVSVVVSPSGDTKPVGTEHCVTATLTDAFGNAVPAVTVRFRVEGAAEATGVDTSDVAGQARFCYAGPELPGVDEITVHVDADGDGALDEGEPLGAAAASWLLPDSTAGQATGGGIVPAHAGGSAIAFAFHARSSSSGLKGHCLVIDPAAAVWVRCLDVQAFAREGTRAVFFGRAIMNGTATTYRIDVEDVDDPGRDHDSFHVRTGGGYAAGGVLAHGNVQVR